MIIVFSCGNLIYISLKMFVFTKADYVSYYYKNPECDLTVPNTEVKKLSAEDCARQEAENKKRADEERDARRQDDLVRDISMILVGLPVFITHWLAIRKREKTI
jgi:hypothetical protein